MYTSFEVIQGEGGICNNTARGIAVSPGQDSGLYRQSRVGTRIQFLRRTGRSGGTKQAKEHYTAKWQSHKGYAGTPDLLQGKHDRGLPDARQGNKESAVFRHLSFENLSSDSFQKKYFWLGV
jgi:hypothetical protein